VQLFVILVAVEVLLLCLRSLYFCMAFEQIGALLRMVLIVIKVRSLLAKKRVMTKRLTTERVMTER
jgi:hypothetical protein